MENTIPSSAEKYVEERQENFYTLLVRLVHVKGCMGKDRVTLRWLDLLIHELKEWGIFCNFLLSGNAKMQRKFQVINIGLPSSFCIGCCAFLMMHQFVNA